ncbi:MAG: hypothetical protein ACTTJX_01810 [Fusobacterium sp.]|uniref:hypothetical protein n=1 Tax=Fusobacterium sp. TaxID=68766 RepID=UPI003F9EDFAC
MLNKEIIEKIKKIMELGLEINSRKKNTIFIRFSGHCEILEVVIHSKGWENGLGADFFKNIYFTLSSKNEVIEILDEIIEKLEKLKTI